MTNPLKQLSINSISRAAANILAVQRKHQEFHAKLNREKELDVVRAVSVTEQRIASATVPDVELERVALSLLPAAEDILVLDMLVAERGYFVTHRKIGHLLPLQYKWTVAGVRIINAFLAKVPSTASYMENWGADIAKHIVEMQKDEDARELRQKRYEQENVENYNMLCDKLDRLQQVRNPMLSNYKHLHGYLRHDLPQYFHGARGVKLIHAALNFRMSEQASQWKVQMNEDLAEAVRRDEEFRNAKRAGRRYQNPNNGLPSDNLLKDGGSVALNAMYDDLMDPSLVDET
jgi:hypothetical protein